MKNLYIINDRQVTKDQFYTELWPAILEEYGPSKYEALGELKTIIQADHIGIMLDTTKFYKILFKNLELISFDKKIFTWNDSTNNLLLLSVDNEQFSIIDLVKYY